MEILVKILIIILLMILIIIKQSSTKSQIITLIMLKSKNLVRKPQFSVHWKIHV